MNKHLIIILMLCLIPFVAAREELVYTINACENVTITVNASLPIDNEEYRFFNFSGDTTSNQWNTTCERSHHLPIILITNDSTINTYTLSITYTYEEMSTTVTQHRHSGGSGGHSCGIGYTYLNNTCRRINSTNASSPSTPSAVTPPVTPPPTPPPAVVPPVAVMVVNATNEVAALENVTLQVVETSSTDSSHAWLVPVAIIAFMVILGLSVMFWYARQPPKF